MIISEDQQLATLCPFGPNTSVGLSSILLFNLEIAMTVSRSQQLPLEPGKIGVSYMLQLISMDGPSLAALETP